MKKYLFLLVCVLLAQSFYAKSKTDNVKNDVSTEQEVPHRKIYGFFRNHATLDGYGIGSFYSDDVNNTELIYPFYNQEAIFAGAAANGIYYACTYKYEIRGPKPDKLISIDITTGERKDIGSSSLKVQDMTFNYKDQKMYAVGFESGTSSLYTIDINTGNTNKEFDFPCTAFGIAANYEGEIFITAGDGFIYKVDIENKKIDQFYSLKEKGYGGALSTTIEFDHTDGSLYWATDSYEKDRNYNFYLNRLVFKDSENIEFQELGIIGGSEACASMQGLYIPFVLDGENTPAHPTDLKIIPNQNGELKATLKWTNPTNTFGGEPLSELTSVTIIRNNDTIAKVQTTEIGGQMEWNDETIPSYGEYKYTIYASNNAGNGETNICKQYIGPDAPAAVKNVIAKTINNCESVSLSWNRPENGAHGNYCDPEGITYKIIRYPDETIIVENLKDTSYIDSNIKRLARYYYEVYAINDIGESTALSNNYIVAGPAMDMPYYETFSDLNATINQISAYDYNHDEYSWLIASGYGYYQFGDETPAIEYLLNPTLTPTEIKDDANEWIMTPPLKLEGGKQYALKFDYRAITNENLEITIGNNNSVEAQKIHENIELKALEGESTDFTEYISLLPVISEDCIQCIGLHLTTPFPEDIYSYLQITNIEIKEYVSVDKTEVKDLVSVKCTNGSIIIEGIFNEAEVYSADGMKVASTSENIIPAGTLEKGLYLVRVMKDNKAETFKVML